MCLFTYLSAVSKSKFGEKETPDFKLSCQLSEAHSGKVIGFCSYIFSELELYPGQNKKIKRQCAIHRDTGCPTPFYAQFYRINGRDGAGIASPSTPPPPPPP